MMTCMKRCLVLLIFSLGVGVFESNADVKSDLGFTSLLQEWGSSVPDGDGIRGTQVEAPLATGEWMPDPEHVEFQGKTLNDKSGSGGSYSSHATSVLTYLFGNTTSMAPGVNIIDCYEANHFTSTGFLRATSSWQPAYSSSRVANHSWVGSSPTYASTILRRLDWVIDRDEFIHIVANSFSTSSLMGSGFNSIAVGRTSGETGVGTIYVDPDYTAGRQAPHIVVPFSYLSSATPWGGAASAMLIEKGHKEPVLSTDPVVTYKTNRSGNRVYNAERSEVIKAILMAGAERFTENTTSWEITDYRIDPAHRSNNNLDKRYGAGQLNIYNSCHILAGGEQNSLEDDPASGGMISFQGFDYDPLFGGQSGSNSTAAYYFSTDESHTRIAVSLVWNIFINGGSAYSFNGSSTLYDMDLHLYDVSDPVNPVLVAASTASGVNHEHLYAPLERNKTYSIRVQKGSGQSDFLWDYGIAFHFIDDGDRDGMPDYFELENGLNPDDPVDGETDPDMDDLTNVEEYTHGTSPQNSDTDGDTFPDGEEVAGGYDPTDPLSHPPYYDLPGLTPMAFIVLEAGLLVIGQWFFMSDDRRFFT